MATIPNTQKFHTVADAIDTTEYGSAQLAAGRTVFTMQDILDTVVVGGGVDGSGTAGFIPLWSDSNTIGDSVISATASLVTIGSSANLSLTGQSITIPATGKVLNEGNVATTFGFYSNVGFRVESNSNIMIEADQQSVRLKEAGVLVFQTAATGVSVTGYATSTVSTTGGSSATTLTTKDYVDGLASNYATAAQGTLATNALPLAGGTLTGALTTLGVSAADVVANSFAVDALQAAPTSASAAGTLGEIRYALDGGVHYIYLCIATDTWQRVALATWV